MLLNLHTVLPITFTLLYILTSVALNTCEILQNLQESERRVYSQNGEDGIVLEILRAIGIKTKDFVEFGVQDGQECNTRILREQLGFNGVMFDGGFENHRIGLYKEFITVHNIVELFKKYNVSKSFDVLSVDTDMFDWWLLAQLFIRGGYRPRVIIVEVNPTLNLNVGDFSPSEFAAVNSQPLVVIHPNMTTQTYWDITRYYGANPAAFQKLGKEFGYEMVYCERCGVNCFMVLASEISDSCNRDFLLPSIPYPRFGVPNVTYAGHRIDTSYRKAVLIDNDLLFKIIRNVATVTDIEYRLKDPILESRESFFGRLCTDDLPDSLPLPIGFSREALLDIDAFAATCTKSSCVMLSDHYTRSAVDMFRTTRNISLVEELFGHAVKLNAHNFFASRALKLVSQLNKFLDIRSYFSIGLIRGQLSHSGASTNRSLRVNMCDSFESTICHSHFVDEISKCSIVEKEYFRILRDEIYFGSEDFQYLAERYFSKDVEKSFSCIGMKNLDMLSALIASRCEHGKASKNVFVFGPPGSGIEGIERLLNSMLGVSIDTETQKKILDLNDEALCILEDLYTSHGICSNFQDIQDFPLDSFDKIKILAKNMYSYRDCVKDEIFLFVNHTLSVSLDVWRAAIDERKTVYVFVLTDPAIAATEMSKRLNLSFEEALDRWVYYLNAALKFFDSYRGTIIMVSFDGAGYSKELILDLFKYFEAYNYTKDTMISFEAELSSSCSSAGLCGFFEEGLSMISNRAAPAWINKCYQILRDSPQANADNKFLITECLSPG